jgi:Sec-independent protein translocase protein TatA
MDGFGSIGLPHLLVLLVIALILFGPSAFGGGARGPFSK